MKENIMTRAAEMARAQKVRRDWLISCVCMAVIVAFGTFSVVMSTGRAMTAQVKVLHCRAAGTVAHIHNDDCYNENGSLVCPLPEIAPHTHGEGCYDEENNLVCGMQELSVHVHGADCFVIEELGGEEIAAMNAAAIAAEAEAEAAAAEESAGCAGPAEETELPEAPESSDPVVVIESGDSAEQETPAERVVFIMTGEENADDTADAEPAAEAEAGADTAEPAETRRVFYMLEPEDEAPEAPGAGEEPEPAGEAGSVEEPSGEPIGTVFMEEAVSAEPEQSDGQAASGEPGEAPEMPAQFFEAEAGGVKVTVEAEAGTFPAGTVMRVTAVEDEAVMSAAAAAVEGRVTDVQAVSIVFFGADGGEVEPAKAIRVTMVSDLITGADDSVIVCVQDGAAELVDADVDTAAVFEAAA